MNVAWLFLASAAVSAKQAASWYADTSPQVSEIVVDFNPGMTLTFKPWPYTFRARPGDVTFAGTLSDGRWGTFRAPLTKAEFDDLVLRLQGHGFYKLGRYHANPFYHVPKITISVKTNGKWKMVQDSVEVLTPPMPGTPAPFALKLLEEQLTKIANEPRNWIKMSDAYAPLRPNIQN
jgi:hypothetical protein